jgi:hypothetical protein
MASPLIQQHLVRALAEAPLAVFLLLTLVLCTLAIRRQGSGAIGGRWALAVGTALGLGLGTKLTLGISLAAMLAWAALVAAVAGWPWAAGSPRTAAARAWAAGRGWLAAVLLALAVFVLSDPHLYPNPPLHLVHMLKVRAGELGDPDLRYHPDAFVSLVDRTGYVISGTVTSFAAPGSLGLPLAAALAAVGVGGLILATWRGWRQGRLVPEGLVALTMLAYLGGTSAVIHLPWDRYLVPPFLLAALASGLGAARLSRALARLAGRIGPASAGPRRQDAAASAGARGDAWQG